MALGGPEIPGSAENGNKSRAINRKKPVLLENLSPSLNAHSQIMRAAFEIYLSSEKEAGRKSSSQSSPSTLEKK
jgi:hypothetical protein